MLIKQYFQKFEKEYAALLFELMVLCALAGITFGLSSLALAGFIVRGMKIVRWEFYLLYLPTLVCLFLAFADGLTFFTLKKTSASMKKLSTQQQELPLD
jgi:uncharacterized membrane protein YqjE